MSSEREGIVILRKNLDYMFQAACKVCDNILDFQPDLVLALMHSAQGAVFAAQVLWQEKQSVPFPATARSNIGREKLKSFDKTHRLITSLYFVGQYSDDLDIGKLLAWIQGRADWREQLRQQVAEAMGTTGDPQRILVVDDTIHEGSTFILTQGLLEWIYPKAKLRLLNVESWFSYDYMDFMLEKIYPCSELFPDIPDKEKIPQDLQNHLKQVAMGTEDKGEDSLFWQPVSLTSPSVQALEPYRPAQDWVQVHQKIYTIMADFVREKATSYVPGAPNPKDFSFGLRMNWRILRDLWLENRSTRRQVEQRYGLSAKEAKRVLDNYLDYNTLALVGYGRGAYYIIPDAIRRYFDGLEKSHPLSMQETYWLRPDRLLFGYQPFDMDEKEVSESERQKIHTLLDLGVNYWLDVRITREGDSPVVHPVIAEEAEAREITLSTQVVPLALDYINKKGYLCTRRGRPNQEDIRQVLDIIDRVLAEEYVLFVSFGGFNLRGITAGCYLARHGQTGKAALLALQACRVNSPNGWKREPPSRLARRFVRSWPEGL